MRAASTPSSSARCTRMASKIWSLFICGSEANGGFGRAAQRPCGLQRGLGALDHALVDSALGEPDGVRDAGGARAAVRRHRDAAQAEHDAAADVVLRELVTQLAELALHEQAADRGERRRASGVAD